MYFCQAKHGFSRPYRISFHFVSQIAEFAYDDQPNKKIKVYNLGFPIGSKLHEEVTANDAVAEHYVLNNHLRFKILYHPAADEMDDIPGEGLGFGVEGMIFLVRV